MKDSAAIPRYCFPHERGRFSGNTNRHLFTSNHTIDESFAWHTVRSDIWVKYVDINVSIYIWISHSMFTNITYYVPFINQRTMCVLAVTGEFPSQRPVARSFDVFYLICTWTNGWANHRGSGDLWRHRAHYDVSVTNLVDVTAANDLATIAR